MNLPSLPEDKANHFVYGAIITCVTSIFFGPYWALAVVSAVGIAKEISDWWQNRKGGSHGIEFWDAAATIAGGVVVVLPKLIK